MLSRDDGHLSPCLEEFNEDDGDLPSLKQLPLDSEERTSAFEPHDPKKESETYIEALEPIKFDTAELVVRKQWFVRCREMNPFFAMVTWSYYINCFTLLGNKVRPYLPTTESILIG